MDIATLRMAVDSTQVARSQRDLDGLTAKAGQTEAAVTRMSSRSSAAFGEMSGFITQVASVLAAANLAQQYIKIADGVTQLNNQLKLAMGNAQGAAQAYGDLYKIAQASRVSFTDLASTFAQIRRATEDTGLSYSRLLTVTEAIGNAMAVSGGSTQGMNAALIQLQQGLASGVLRGEELNSVMEQTPRLAQAIADGLGITRGQLRALGADGKLTSEAVVKALESQAGALKNEVAGATMTVAQANTVLGNSVSNLVGTIDNATGASGIFANELKQLSQELDHLNWVMKMTEKEGGGAFMQMLNALGAAVGRFSFSLLSNTFSQFNWAVNKLTGGLFGLNEQVDLIPMNLEITDSQMKMMEHSVKAAGERVEKLREALGRVPDNIYLKDELASTTRFIERTKAAIEAQKELASWPAMQSNVSVGSGDVQLLRAQNKEWQAGAEARKKFLDDAKTGAQKFSEEMEKAKKAFAGAVDPSVEKHLRQKYLKPTQEVKEAERLAKEEMKRMADIDKDASKQVEDVWKKTDAINEQAKKLNMTKIALEELTLAELENQMASLQATDRVIPGYITALEAQIKAQKELVQATKDAEAKDASNKSADAALSDFAKLTDKISGEKMRGMFDGATDGAMKFMSALTLVSEIQEKTAAAHDANLQKNGEGTKEFAAMQEKIAKQSADATIDSYATMAGALKGYAKKGTAMYKALESAEKVLHAFRLASAVKEIASTLAVGQATAAAGVANQSKGDPYTAFARMAAMAAFMATLGFSVSGSGKSLPQTNQGTGTVFGDETKQSESLTNGISILNETQDTALIYTKKMAESLQEIQNNINGLSNIYIRGGKTASAEQGIFTGKFDTGLSSALNAVNSLFSSIGIPNFGGLVTSLFGGKTSITGSGIGGYAQRFGDVELNGFQGYNYADIQTKKKAFGMTYSTSNRTVTSAMSDEIEQQITSVFTGIGDSLTTATELLNQDASLTKDRLQNFIIDIGRIDLKGLTGEQITEKFNAVFSQQADKMAQVVVPGLERLVKAGEGYYETLIRVAQQYELVTVYAERLGHSFKLAGTDGAIFADKLVKLFGGATEFASAMGDYYEQFYSAEERAAMARKEVEKALDSLGKDMPASIEAYRAMVTDASLDTSDEGMKLYASLIKLGPAFADAMKESTKAADAWKGLSDNMMAEAKRLRDLNVSQSASNGLAYLQSQFAINTAAARSGDKTAAGMLPKLSQSIADAEMLNATSSAEVAVLRGQMAASLEETSRIVTGQPVNINAPIQTASAAEDTKAMRQQIEFLNERIQTLTDNTQAENQAMVTMTNKIVRILQDVSQEGQSLSVTVVS